MPLQEEQSSAEEIAEFGRFCSMSDHGRGKSLCDFVRHADLIGRCNVSAICSEEVIEIMDGDTVLTIKLVVNVSAFAGLMMQDLPVLVVMAGRKRP